MIDSMTKKEKLELERLQRLLEAERERSEKAWSGYRDALYELVDIKMKLERIEKVLRFLSGLCDREPLGWHRTCRRFFLSGLCDREHSV